MHSGDKHAASHTLQHPGGHRTGRHNVGQPCAVVARTARETGRALRAWRQRRHRRAASEENGQGAQRQVERALEPRRRSELAATLVAHRRELAAAVPGARLEMLASGNHFYPLTRREALLGKLLPFLT